MKIKYTIELDNAIIGVDPVVARVNIEKTLGGNTSSLTGVFLLDSRLDDHDGELSSASISALLESIGKLTGKKKEPESPEVPKTETRKTARRKPNAG